MRAIIGCDLAATEVGSQRQMRSQPRLCTTRRSPSSSAQPILPRLSVSGEGPQRGSCTLQVFGTCPEMADGDARRHHELTEPSHRRTVDQAYKAPLAAEGGSRKGANDRKPHEAAEVRQLAVATECTRRGPAQAREHSDSPAHEQLD